MTPPCVCDTVFKAMRNFRISQDFCDIELVVQNRVFYAHKVLLAASSEYFRAMFLGKMLEKLQPAIEIHEVSADIFMTLLDCVYGAELQIEDDNVEDVIIAADMLRIHSIVECCQVYLVNQLDSCNSVGLYCFAKQRSFLNLKKAAWDFIMKNFHSVILEGEFLSISFELLNKMTLCEEIAVKSEKDVLQCIVRWLSHDPRERRGNCVSLLKNVRKNLISKYEVNETLIQVEDLCLKIAITVLMQNAPIVNATHQLQQKSYQPRISARKSFYTIGGCTYMPSQRYSQGNNDFIVVSYIERFDSFCKNWDRYPISLRKARSSLAAAQVDRKVYIMGGESDSIIYGIIECYDTASKTWKRELPSMVVPRSSFQAVVHAYNIYLIGGDIGSGAGKSIEIYDTRKDQCGMVSFEMQSGRHSFGATCCDNILYMAGGIGLSGRELDTMECYDLRRRDWWFTKSMNTKRANFSLVTIGSSIYAVGGHSTDMGTLNSVEKYDTYKNVWMPCAPMVQARAGAFVAVMDSHIVVVGGKCKINCHAANPPWQILSTSEVYDCDTDSWTQCERMNMGMRCDGAAVVI